MSETDLITSVGNIMNVIKPDLIWMVAQSSIAVFLVLIIKDFITSAVDLITFRSSPYMCIGTKVRVPHPTGFNDCIIVDVNRKFITLENKDLRLLLPLKTFKESQWTLIKSDSEIAVKFNPLNEDDNNGNC